MCRWQKTTTMPDLIYSNYKLPLLVIPKTKGHGYYGAIAQTKDGTKIQCHVCGEMKESLALHLREHELTALAYKDKFKLAHKTALVCDKLRVRMIQHGKQVWANKTKAEKELFTTWTQKYGTYVPPLGTKISLETRNKRGNCPQQLLKMIEDFSKPLGRAPKLDEFRKWSIKNKRSGLVGSVYKTFGSWNKAVSMLGYTPRKNKVGYSKEYLLEMLRVFYKTNKRLPSKSDTKRGLIPDRSVYWRNFGTLKKARKLAGII